LPFAVPVLLSGPVSGSGRSGLLTTSVVGRQPDSAHWAEVREGFSAVLQALGRVPAEAAAEQMPPPRSWCGGSGWPNIVKRRFMRQMPAVAAERAGAVIEDVICAEQAAAPGLVHGDLGLHNVLWTAGCVSGVIDFDHACWGDPAVDVAPLVGAFSAGRVAGLVETAVLHRALIHRASLSLQVAAAAELIGNNGLRDHAVKNFIIRLQEGTLYDPGGACPSDYGGQG
jgi:aminoglycoside phosphotransferase (APT) family kinase protein